MKTHRLPLFLCVLVPFFIPTAASAATRIGADAGADGYVCMIGTLAGWNPVSSCVTEPVPGSGYGAIPSGNPIVPEVGSVEPAVAAPSIPPTSRPVVRPVVAAPYPKSYKKVDGRLVCAKKNDHPSKSKKNKKGHMDMECCLDPDEIPNPHCHYPPEKYGKYLK